MIRDLLIRDLGWKLFSLLLAVMIWLTVHRILEERSTGSPVIYSGVPVLIVAAAADVHFYHVSPALVDVTVSGTPEAMAMLQTNQIHAVVDLAGLPDLKPLGGTRQSVDVSVPPGVTVIKVDPPQVNVVAPPQAD